MRGIPHFQNANIATAITSQRTTALRSIRASFGGGGAGGREVDTPGMKRVALTQAHDRKQAAFPRAVDTDALRGVAGARRLEPARRPHQRHEHGRDEPLVGPDEREEELGDHVGAFFPAEACALFGPRATVSKARFRRGAETPSHSARTAAKLIKSAP